MLKRAGVSLAILVVMTASVSAAVYDYSEAGMDGADWTMVDNGKWLGWATVSNGADYARVDYTYPYDGAGNTSKLGVAWAAPAGEVITSVTFTYTYNANPVFFCPVVYQMAASDVALTDTTPMVWSASQSGYIIGTETLTFSQASNVEKVAMGLDVPSWGYVGFLAQFSDVTITTVPVPEPVTLAMLASGGVAMLRRRV